MSNMMKQILVTALSFVAWSATAQISTNRSLADNSGNEKSSGGELPKLQLRGSVPTIFATLVRDSGLSGGVTTLNDGCSEGQEAAISIPAGTSFDKAVAQVVTIRPRSGWQLRDGVANLFSSGAIPPLLKVQIRSLRWDRNAPAREVISQLRQLPEVSEEARRLGLREAPIEGGSSTICIRGDCREKTRPDPLMEMEQDVPLLTVLNRVAQAHKGSVWGYSEYRCEKGTLFSLSVLSE
jgi:hypothetical protein